MSRLKNRLLAIMLSCSLVLSPSGQLWAVDELPELGDVAGADLSPLAEKKIGRKIMNEIRWHEPMYLDDPEVEAYLNRLGSRLVAASPDPAIGFEFFAVNDRMINAFATFGGYVGVNTGLLLNADSESELAGVLAHEVSHVTQHHLARQISQGKVASMAVLAAMVVALLAAHSSSSAGMGAAVGAQAGVMQSQLGFSRDFEREADRVGLQTLNKAGFDPTGMSGFFAKLQKASRVYENNAPVYLRTHPLTTERIADMQNRESLLPYHQVPDSLEFHLIRAKLRAEQGTPAEATKYFRDLLGAGKAQHAGAATYGLAIALSRVKDWVAVDKTIADARQQRLSHTMLDRLAAESRLAQGDVVAGLKAYVVALSKEPDNPALIYGYAEALVRFGRAEEAFNLTDRRLRKVNSDGFAWQLQAKSAAALGRKSAEHRAQGEFYALQEKTAAAVEQFQIAQQAGDGDFYEMSMIDARLQVLKRKRIEEISEGRKYN
ncbi:MAG: hypothetical protein RIR18_1183 [Pseudomonadota bacterium]|jgi:predicted Zn-dependent protease